MEKYGFVYIWFDRKHKRYYIGSHWGYENDGYICSSTWMNSAFKRRPNDFKRRIIKKINTSKSDLLEQEYYYLSLIPNEELGKKYYNLRNIKNGHWSTDEQKRQLIVQKMSKIRTGQKLGPRGPRSDEIKNKISSKLIGKPRSIESVTKQILVRTGAKHKPHKPHKIYPKVTCPHCKLLGSGGVMKRYHFDNCKGKK